jgi:fucose permease
LNSASNVLVADLHDDPSRKNSALNLLGVFFGFGALFLPLTIGSLVKTLGLPAILWVATGLSVAPAFVFAPIRFPAPKEGGGFRLSEAGYVLRNRLLLLFGAVLFFQSGSEFIIGGYASTYLTTELGSSLSTASYALAGYWGCIMAGRVVSSRLLLKLQANTLLRISAIGSALGVAGLILSSDRAFGTLSLVVIGLSFAAIFPTTLGLAANSFGSYLGTVFGLLFAMALTGGMTLPWVVGQVAEVHGLRIGLTLVVGNFLVMLALQVLMARPRQES